MSLWICSDSRTSEKCLWQSTDYSTDPLQKVSNHSTDIYSLSVRRHVARLDSFAVEVLLYIYSFETLFMLYYFISEISNT